MRSKCGIGIAAGDLSLKYDEAPCILVRSSVLQSEHSLSTSKFAGPWPRASDHQPWDSARGNIFVLPVSSRNGQFSHQKSTLSHNFCNCCCCCSCWQCCSSCCFLFKPRRASGAAREPLDLPKDIQISGEWPFSSTCFWASHVCSCFYVFCKTGPQNCLQSGSISEIWLCSSLAPKSHCLAPWAWVWFWIHFRTPLKNGSEFLLLFFWVLKGGVISDVRAHGAARVPLVPKSVFTGQLHLEVPNSDPKEAKLTQKDCKTGQQSVSDLAQRTAQSGLNNNDN